MNLNKDMYFVSFAAEAFQVHNKMLGNFKWPSKVETFQVHNKMLGNLKWPSKVETFQVHNKMLTNLKWGHTFPVFQDKFFINSSQYVLNPLKWGPKNVKHAEVKASSVRTIERLETFYEAIKDKEVIAPNISLENDGKVKDFLKEFILYSKQLMGVFNIVDSSKIWDFLNAATTIITLVQFLVGPIDFPEIMEKINFEKEEQIKKETPKINPELDLKELNVGNGIRA